MANLKSNISKIHYGSEKPHLLLGLLLSFLSVFYGFAVNFRNFFYKIGVIKTYRPEAKVISIGNLTTGGTGKTPVTAKIANFIQNEKGLKTAIISRGYGGSLSIKQTNVISDGENIFYNAEDAGDEPFWLSENTKNVVVITGKDRVKSIEKAINDFSCEVVILDDGYQHLKVERDLNILTIDATRLFGNGKLLPAGPLRESEKSIKRADVVLMVNKEPFNQPKGMFFNGDYLKNTAIIENCDFKYEDIYNIFTKKVLSLPAKISTLTAIAQPEPFIEFLKGQNFDIIKERAFSDHHLYTREDIREALEEAQGLDMQAIVITEKDAVKIKPLLEEKEKPFFYAVKLDVELNLDKILERIL